MHRLFWGPKKKSLWLPATAFSHLVSKSNTPAEPLVEAKLPVKLQLLIHQLLVEWPLRQTSFQILQSQPEEFLFLENIILQLSKIF